MSGQFNIAAPGLSPLDALRASAPVSHKVSPANMANAKATAQNFEAMFLNSMLQQMYTGIDGEGPFGGKGATGIWRSFLTDAYAKTFAKAGGVGIADQVYRSMIAMQEAHS
jgi:Rod binding domain-containing protein